MPKNKQEYLRVMKQNKPFYRPYSHSIPSHIFRADYAQFKLRELASKSFSGSRVYIHTQKELKARRAENITMYGRLNTITLANSIKLEFTKHLTEHFTN